MARGYSKHWPRNFLPRFETENDCKWDLQDALRFKTMPHFRIPGDKIPSKAVLQGTIQIEPAVEAEDTISISCTAGLAFVEINYDGHTRRMDVMDWKSPCTTFDLPHLNQEYDRAKPLSLTILAMNGKQRIVKDVWKLLAQASFIRIPDSDMVLRKQSVRSDALDTNDQEDEFCEWAVLLQEKGADGVLHRATAIDLRVGAIMDGAVVYYADGHHTNCGKPGQRRYGGHASEKQSLPANVDIGKVEIRKTSDGWGSLGGIRMTLENGTRWGELHDHDSIEAMVLEPANGEKIVGFFGQSDEASGFCFEFGIVTAPKGREMPDVVYDMRELRNRVEEY
jgi:hypothetical protein